MGKWLEQCIRNRKVRGSNPTGGTRHMSREKSINASFIPIEKVYETHEKEKKRAYNERVIQVEKGSFTPIVMSTFGGMGVEAKKFHKRIATLISEKRGERYSDVVNYLRTRLRFSILRSVLTAVRGVRGKSRNEMVAPISTLSFNLIENNELN